jgi:GT2 family glycosyltransferase
MSTPSHQAFVSIVTPVYNGEPWLRECIESVLAQTWGNWEFVILDNASRDGSLAIAREYAARDARIRVHANPRTVPMVQNHNAALRLMSEAAQWCKPLMADDWLKPQCVELMVAAAQRDPAIGLVCAWAFDGRHVIGDGWPYPAGHVDGREVARRHLLDYQGTYTFGSPTVNLVRAALVRKVPAFYPEENLLGSDFQGCLQVLAEADYAFVHEVLAFSRVHAASVTAGAVRLQGGVLGKMHTILRCGGQFLSAAELAALRERLLAEHYRMLAYQSVHRPGRAFWDFQERHLSLMGCPLERRRLRRAVLAHLIERALNPGELLRDVLHRLRRRTPATSEGAQTAPR